VAGPLFSLAEQEFNTKLNNKLIEKGFHTFLPQDECKDCVGVEIFNKCKEGIDTSDIVLANMDGADADSGTCWECGYAFANHKFIIAYRTDFRKSGDTGGFNAMLYFSANKLIEGDNYLSQIIEALNSVPAFV